MVNICLISETTERGEAPKKSEATVTATRLADNLYVQIILIGTEVSKKGKLSNETFKRGITLGSRRAIWEQVTELFVDHKLSDQALLYRVIRALEIEDTKIGR